MYGLEISVLLSIFCSILANQIYPPGSYRCLITCSLRCSGKKEDCTRKCQKLSREVGCQSTDSRCWDTCGNPSPSANGSKLGVPKNLTVEYSRKDVLLANLSWERVLGAKAYVIQFVEIDNEKTDLADRSSYTLTLNPSTIVRKPELCIVYAMRIAAISLDFGFGDFSEIFRLENAQVPSAPMTLSSMLMSNAPYRSDHDPSMTSSRSIRVMVRYQSPVGWNGTRGDFDPEFDLIMGECSINDASKNFFLGDVSKIKISRQNSTALFTFPDFLLADQCDVVITLSIKSKCGQISESSFLPLNFNCSSVENSNCSIPEPAETPTCRVSNFRSKFDWSTKKLYLEWEAESNLIGRLRGFYYVINKLQDTYENRHNFRHFGHLQEERVLNDTVLLDKQNSTTVNLTLNFNVSKDSFYLMSICEKFDDDQLSPKIENWDVVEKYTIDIKSDPDNQDQKSNITLIIIFSILLLSILGVALYFYVKKRFDSSKIKVKSIKQLTTNQNDDQYRYVLSPRRFDHWEIPRKKLIIYEDQKLGSGAFGAVYKGKISGKLLTHVNANAALAEQWMQAENCEVAVKMLPDYADDVSKSEFNKEINLMKQLGYHERLVNMLGCVTADDPICLIVEYCSDGDLLQYLRNRRKFMATVKEPEFGNLDTVDQGMILSLKDLLSFAWQISVGMQYLEHKGFIHRDLAARNILVDKGKKAKIGDFGLCRFSSPDSTYVCKGGRLPLKWMALEAIKTHEFTTKSDVWSFGVLLFEIVTLGGTPYPGVEPADMEPLLEKGHRMEKPENCPDEIYDLMVSTWRENPEERPDFGQLTPKLAQLLENSSDQNYYYLKLDQEKNYHNTSDVIQNGDDLMQIDPN